MDETTKAEFMEIQKKMMENRSQLQQCGAMIRTKTGDVKRSELTVEELKDVPDDCITYKGIGRAFMYVPKPQLQEQLEKKAQDLTDEIEKLKGQQERFEKAVKESENSMGEFIENTPALKAQFAR